MGKRILIISYFFAPQNAMGAVRPTKLAKYLSRMGHEVTVLCGPGMNARKDPTLARDLEALPDVRIIQEWNPLRDLRAHTEAKPAAAQTPAAPSAMQEGALHAAKDVVYRWLRWQADRSFRRRAVAALGELNGVYDVVFSTYAPWSVHEIAREAKRRGMARRWIADFRDEVGTAFAWQKGKKSRYLRMLRREADVLCAASQGFLEMMGFEDAGHVLSNGFDREDLPPVADAPAHTGKLRVVYCGMLSMGRKGVGDRDLTPMLRALAALIKRGQLARSQVALVYAGGESALMHRQAAACGMGDLVEDHGLVSREESIALQQGADILLMASWHMASQRGILTGKLFEYMMMDKPIVCCMSGDLPGSGVKQVLDETGMGLCVEQAAGAADVAALDAYMTDMACRWKQGMPLLSSKNADEVERYAYPALAERLLSWMED